MPFMNIQSPCPYTATQPVKSREILPKSDRGVGACVLSEFVCESTEQLLIATGRYVVNSL